jgi:hypothetical protein
MTPRPSAGGKLAPLSNARANDLVIAWEESPTATDAARRLGADPYDVVQFAQWLRHHGVRLSMRPDEDCVFREGLTERIGEIAATSSEVRA